MSYLVYPKGFPEDFPEGYADSGSDVEENDVVCIQSRLCPELRYPFEVRRDEQLAANGHAVQLLDDMLLFIAEAGVSDIRSFGVTDSMSLLGVELHIHDRPDRPGKWSTQQLARGRRLAVLLQGGSEHQRWIHRDSLEHSPLGYVDDDTGEQAMRVCIFRKHGEWSVGGDYMNWRFGPLWSSKSILAVAVHTNPGDEPSPIIGHRVFPSMETLKQVWSSLIKLVRLSRLPPYVNRNGADAYVAHYGLGQDESNSFLREETIKEHLVTTVRAPCQDVGWVLSENNMRAHNVQFPEWQAPSRPASESSHASYVDRVDYNKAYANNGLVRHCPRNLTSDSLAFILDSRELRSSTVLLDSGILSPGQVHIANNCQRDCEIIRSQNKGINLHQKSSTDFLKETVYQFSVVLLDYMNAAYWPRDMQRLVPDKVSSGGLVAYTCPARTPRTKLGPIERSEDAHVKAESRNKTVVPAALPLFLDDDDDAVGSNDDDVVVGRKACQGFIVEFPFTFSGLFKVILEMMHSRFCLNEVPFVYRGDRKSTLLWHASFGDCRDQKFNDRDMSMSIKDEMYIYFFLKCFRAECMERHQTVSRCDLETLRASHEYPLLGEAVGSFLTAVENFEQRSGQHWHDL